MKIAIILGSVRENRRSTSVADFLALSLNSNEGVEVDLLDLKKYSFPVMTERFRNLENPPKGMADFSKSLINSDGILIISPEYNGSFSGVLKNTLDYFKKEYYKKPLGVVTVSSGSWGGINASHHLLSWALHVKAIPSPFKLMVQNVDSLFDGDGKLLDEDFTLRSEKFLTEFLWLVRSISTKV